MVLPIGALCANATRQHVLFELPSNYDELITNCETHLQIKARARTSLAFPGPKEQDLAIHHGYPETDTETGSMSHSLR